MKKFAIGCLIVLALGVLVLGVGGYFLYRTVAPQMAGLQRFGQLAELDKKIANTATFAVPSTGELTEGMVKRFATVQEGMTASLGPRVKDLHKQFETMEAALRKEKREASVTETLTALSNLATLLVEAKRAQVEALNKAGFSLGEYAWVREQIYSAAGVSVPQMDFGDLKNVASGNEQFMKRLGSLSADIPAINRERVKPITDKLREWAAYGFFGL